MSPPPGTEARVAGRVVRLTNLDKVLWPATGFTKGQMIDYYARVAPVLLPHLTGRPVTLRRFPDGVAGTSFFEKNCPSHRPAWIPTVRLGDVEYCRVEEPAALVWLANLAAVELHPALAAAPHLDRPTAMVFDLDPGPPADALACARVAVLIRDRLERLGLAAWVKTSGSKGLQLYCPLDGEVTYADTRPFARALARLLERDRPELVVSVQEKRQRTGRVLIDWSQNAASKTTVAVYSLRAREEPSVSTPITWDELDAALEAGDVDRLRFGPDAVVERIGRDGDLMAPVLGGGCPLPALTGRPSR